MNKKYGFTLAEVLVTIAIIGVVAALVIPTVVVKYEKMQTVTRLKKEYSELYNAYRLSVKDNGSANNWNFSLSTIDFYKKYLQPYLKGSICTNKTGECKSYSMDTNYTFTPSVVLNDGSCMLFAKDNGFRIELDLNCSKKPNLSGRDIFLLGISNNAQTVSYCKMKEPFGFNCRWCGACTAYGQSQIKMTRETWLSQCKTGTAKPNCGGLIQYDGWEIKDDYPW